MIFKNKTHYLLLGLCLMTSLRVAAMDISLVYIGDEKNTAYLGARQGLDEANLLGQFLGQTYKLDLISVDEIHKHDFTPYSAVFTGLDSIDTFSVVARQLPSLPVFNLSIDDDSLRTSCISNAFHTIPSQSMKKDAVSQYLQKKPDSKAVAQAWHPDFVKFAARDLNKRYKASAGLPMDDNAWAGWAAVKMTSDSVARISSSDPIKLMEYLKSSLKFDGQKGGDMNFRETGQLRQLLLLVEDDEIVTEAPVRGIANSLDSLGLLKCEQ